MISVIIPSFNRFESLKLAVQSVLDQTYKNYEIIIINDCSTQSEYYTGELELFPQTTVLHLPINLRTKFNVTAAQGKTRDEGIKIANGKWISFLDDDDCFLPTKFETQLIALSDNDHTIQMCSSNMYCGHLSYNPHRSYPLYDNKHTSDTVFTLDVIKTCNYISNSTVLISKKLIDKIGEFKVGKDEDYDYWLRCLKYTNCYYVALPLSYYDLSHFHGKNYV